MPSAPKAISIFFWWMCHSTWPPLQQHTSVTFCSYHAACLPSPTSTQITHTYLFIYAYTQRCTCAHTHTHSTHHCGSTQVTPRHHHQPSRNDSYAGCPSLMASCLLFTDPGACIIYSQATVFCPPVTWPFLPQSKGAWGSGGIKRGDTEAITHRQGLYITDIYTAKNIPLKNHICLLLYCLHSTCSCGVLMKRGQYTICHRFSVTHKYILGTKCI